MSTHPVRKTLPGAPPEHVFGGNPGIGTPATDRQLFGMLFCRNATQSRLRATCRIADLLQIRAVSSSAYSKTFADFATI